MNVSVLIPAYNPEHILLQLINSLIDVGFNHIIIVNDGSATEESKQVFSKIKDIKECHLLIHEKNSGKGRALKTGLSYFLTEFKDDIGVVTGDCDGQHKAKDIANIANELKSNPTKLILGARTFDKSIPFRSWIGNIVTKLVFLILIGSRITDTQTGLRGIPRVHIPTFIQLEGEGYEFEMNVLMASKANRIDIVERKIETIYIRNNQSSHFNPLIDSMKIYFLLFRFSLSSLVASIIDVVVFSVAYHLTANTFISIFIGRFTIGPIVNYTMNKKLVFHNKGRIIPTFIKYIIFTIMMGLAASNLINYIADNYGIEIIFAKILVEVFLFIICFKIQKDYIFTLK